MRIKEYGAFPPWNVGPGGKNNPYDEFNRAMKGGGFPRKYGKEYASSDLEEYHRYSERNDNFIEEQKKKREKRDDPNSEEAKKAKARKNNRMRQNLLKQVVGLAVGSVIVVTSYQARAERRAQEEQQSNDQQTVVDNGDGVYDGTPAVSVEWVWDEEAGTAYAVITDSDGSETTIPAIVTSEDVTYCTKPGVRTYTATVTYEDGNEYTDTREEELPPAGHVPEESFSSANESRFRCTVCGEEVEKITVDYEPET